MRISSSTIGMDSARSYASVTQKTASYLSQTDSNGSGKLQGSLSFRGMLLGGSEEETKTGTDVGENSLADLQGRFSLSGLNKITVREESDTLDHIRQQCIRYLMQLFRMGGRDDGEDLTQSVFGDLTQRAQGQSATTLSVQTSETYRETEQTSFQTTGSVVTADGRTITFRLELEMSRSFQETYEQSYETLYRNVDTCDPLVINLDVGAASVSDQKFLFDIDGDGVKDEVSELNAGSGYLALDKNGDGVINDGNELFGPQSGDGFADLAQYDDDGDGWIDEDDAIWDRLLIWTKDENGEDQLYTLSDKGVGAICLQRQSTEFSLNSLEDNQTNAYIRSTGVFLYENGTVGTVQHVDLAR